MGEIWDKVKGTSKEATGKATGDDSLKREGRFDQAKGDVKGFGNDARDKVSDAVDDVRDEFHDKRRDDEV